MSHRPASNRQHYLGIITRVMTTFRTVCCLPFLLVLSTGVLTFTNDLAAQDQRDVPLDSAAQYFQSACAKCHGVEGRGDGPLASQLNTRPPNLTQISQRHGGNFPTKQIYEKIEGLSMPTAHGTREMPVWGALLLFEELGTSVLKEDAKVAELKTRRRLQKLVDYLRLIQE